MKIQKEQLGIERVTKDNWKNHPDIETSSLWEIPTRRNNGQHQGGYHGNFVPQIAYQLMRRFTSPNDVILDPFMGSGTTLIEAKQIGRNGIGIELNSEVAIDARKRIETEENKYNTWQHVIIGDSRLKSTYDECKVALDNRKRNDVDLIITHPPYHNIIQFSTHPSDLSNSNLSQDDFLLAFSDIVTLCTSLLKVGGFLALIIGDTYSNKRHNMLGFMCANIIEQFDMLLKSITIKDMQNTKAKINKSALWRYRAIAGNYCTFGHEYIFTFQKLKGKNK